MTGDNRACNCEQSLELEKVIIDLIEWSEIMGGWEGACWGRAREAVGIEDEQLGEDKCSLNAKREFERGFEV